MKYDYRIFDELESTSAKAKQLAKEGADEGLVVQAYEQTAGYGRRGDTWDSPLGGLYMSILLKPNVSPDQLPTLTQAIGVAVRRAMIARGLSNVLIKAPNDIVLGIDEAGNYQKLAGILSEKVGESVIVGIGLNVVHFGNPLEARLGNVPVYVVAQAFAEDSRMQVDNVRDTVLNAISEVYDIWHAEGMAALQSEYDSSLCEAGE